MITFLARALRSRLKSLVVAVLGVAIATAATLSVLRVDALLSQGSPAGTTLAGDPTSIFMHSSNMRFDFFLGPRQIVGLQEMLGDSGYVAGSSGTRRMSACIDQKDTEVLVDVVSPNFFAALGVKLNGPRVGDWGASSDPAAVISRRLVTRLGGKAPDQIVVNGVALRVAGVADDFSGLWDQFTEVWVDWRLGPALLFPSIKATATIDDQPWFYWTLAVPKASREAEYSVRLGQALQRRDLAEGPFDSFRGVAGITSHPDLRQSADESVGLYLLVCWVALLVSALNLACWSALTRMAKADAEWAMLCVGMPRWRYFMLGAAYVVIPAALGCLLAIPLELAFWTLLSADPTVSSVLSNSSDLIGRYPWRALLAIFLCTSVVGLLVGKCVALAAGLRYGSLTLKSNSPRLRIIFRSLTALMSALSTAALLVGYWSASASYHLWQTSQAGQARDALIFEVQARDVTRSTAGLDAAARGSLLQRIREVLPEVDSAGYLSIRPYSDGRIPLQPFSLTAGGPTMLNALVNESEQAATEALGARLLAGRALDSSSYASELVIDTRAAAEFARVAGVDTAMGLTVFDVSNTPYKVVGVVDALAYSSDLSRTTPLVYTAMITSPSTLYVALRGALTERRVRELGDTPLSFGDSEVTLKSPVRLHQLAENAQARYTARLVFCLATAIATLAVALAAIISVVLVETQQRLRSLAVMACLGASTRRISIMSCKASVTSVVLGSTLGAGAMLMFAGTLHQTFFAMTRSLSVDGFWPIPLLAALTALSGGIVVERQLRKQSLYFHLRHQ